MLKKGLAILLSVTILLLNLVIVADATETKTEDYKADTLLTPADCGLKIIRHVIEDNGIVYYDENGNEVDITQNNRKLNTRSSFKKTYDLRDENRATGVRDQGSEGLCWDFAATASIESAILSDPKLSATLPQDAWQTLDLSEAGNSWYIYTNVADENSVLHNSYFSDPLKGAAGGFSGDVAMGFASGYGMYPEYLLPYENWHSGYNESMRFYSDYRLREFNTLSDEIDVVKQSIVDNGAVAVSYNCYFSNYNVANDMECYYDNGFAIMPSPDDMGHEVAIIGWDDDFDRENFCEDMRPESNGAWLCKNSWGEDAGSSAEGYEGYFWMSYETAVRQYTQFEVQSVDAFDNIYQSQAISRYTVYGSTSAGNVYTANNDEVLEQVCFSSIGAADLTIDIYKLNEGYSSPTDGQNVLSFNTSVDFSGIHCVDCPQDVNLSKGDIFSIVISDESELQIDYDSNLFGDTENISYITDENGNWVDVADIDGIGHIVIKAYTSNKDNAVYKTELSNSISKAESYDYSESVPDVLIEKLKAQLEISKSVFADENATQNAVDNTTCLLNSCIEDISRYCYEINSLDDFMDFYNASRNGELLRSQYIILNTDLDLSFVEYFMPLYPNSQIGVFEGNNHTISGLNIDIDGDAGFFGKLSGATIQNITFKDCNVRSSGSTGMITGSARNSDFKNCNIINSVLKSTGENCGGIAGYEEECVIENCKVKDCEILGKYGAGAFVGTGTTVTNCDDTGTSLKSTFALHTADSKAWIQVESEYYGMAVATIEGSKCTIEELLGEIVSVTVGDKVIEKNGDVYEFEIEDGAEIDVMVSYKEYEQDQFGYDVDIEKREIELISYYGDDTEITFPSEIGGVKVTSISDQFEFYNREPITSMTFSSGLKNVESFSFQSLYDVETVVFEEGVEVIGNFMFSGCLSLTNVSLPDSLVEIGLEAFAACPRIEKVHFGTNLKTIKDSAFSQCRNLKNIEFSDNFEYIGGGVFAGCAATSVVFGKNIKHVGPAGLGHTTKFQIHFEPVTIPDFKVYGYKGTDAELYAELNDFEFIDISESKPEIVDNGFDYSVFMKGDVDLSGDISILDATAIQKWLVDDIDLSPIQLHNGIVGNVYDDVTVMSATHIQRYVAWIIPSIDGGAAG